MRASQSQRAQPQPLPLPLPLPPPPLSLPAPPATPRRGRHHRSSCSSSSSVSSAASTFCPSPSPAASPARGSTSSLVPFSWERHPGVPKNSFRLASPTGTPLPLPPPLQPPSRRRRRRRPRARVPAASSSSAASDANGSDPFVAAFAECTRDDDGEDDEADHAAVTAAKDKLWPAPAKTTVSGRAAARPWRTASGGFLGFLDLYGCKSAMAVADGVLLARRPIAAGPPGPASGRATTRR
ncbi:unnamed protein product [Urochloa humidicola]